MLTFRANGKLLLTAEYLILDGALGLALPTQYGQSMQIKTQRGQGCIKWKAYDDRNNIWFETEFKLPIVFKASDTQSERFIKQLFVEALNLNAKKIDFNHDYEVSTYLDFPRLWGLGTSSTLIHNLSKWLEVNPYLLLQKTMGGSGYDIACAEICQPLLYQLGKQQYPNVKEVDFRPNFSDQLYFVYLNQKQTSSKEINRYNRNKQGVTEVVTQINQITNDLLKAKDITVFNKLLKSHEQIISKVIDRPVVQSQFLDFDGQLKSLGAWGGDFILASGGTNTNTYFRSKGYNTIIKYNSMVIG